MKLPSPFWLSVASVAMAGNMLMFSGSDVLKVVMSLAFNLGVSLLLTVTRMKYHATKSPHARATLAQELRCNQFFRIALCLPGFVLVNSDSGVTLTVAFVVVLGLYNFFVSDYS